MQQTLVQVGEAFADNKTVTVAKMDATANDVPSDKFSVGLFWTTKCQLWFRAVGMLTCAYRFARASQPCSFWSTMLKIVRTTSLKGKKYTVMPIVHAVFTAQPATTTD